MRSDALPNEKNDNPWLAHFINARWEEVIIAQVAVKRTAGGFELRHTSDNGAQRESLALKHSFFRMQNQSLAKLSPGKPPRIVCSPKV